ncbi:signal recognition particle-docking protein FtsY [Francisella philomiragia]|uniref:Signal recognition particle receptor FtsY n=1 Tax=Francisella philomiragia subsp. philomiragia (strain ATCC 25017 / CCUG 19701 / FSC 153 / O\|nr:signal recognition particle-docking protein FtsY [Francisella philomiragia]AJI47982.1 signal recognition particle-docking protein FtsY [Francisella philomiragia]AJI49197.1 signal recognition particle-docking protein FtsY [Francisella philomiragia]MBK2020391.1 signal recognition particle-docking protein FtsY [Francisella philomiragia]MBK2030091.1 signal recognition particle-docking protein FtsY [Francisella philomiragia]MBK2105896.1 signal recognition particle-docking protein FtsY [Francisel
MFFKKKKETQSSSEIERVQEQDNKKGLFSRLQSGLSKTASKFGSGLSTILMGQKVVDDELLEDIEMQLLTSDVGVEATDEIVEYLRGKVARNELQTVDKLNEIIQDKLTEIILPCQKPLQINHENTPYVILIVGVNGVGKTTTIGKLTKKLQSEGKSVILAAGDTFRAAAVEQLREWGDRNNTQVVYQKEGADSASVIYDAISSAKSRGIDVVIADTAGRLHNKDNLMQELKKVVKVIKKVDDSAPHETMLVVDATTGGNALSQAEAFNEIVNLTGITITKLDGTAKGGIVFSIAKKMGLPLRFIGVGEKIDDLQVFNAKNFTKALFSSNSQQ